MKQKAVIILAIALGLSVVLNFCQFFKVGIARNKCPWEGTYVSDTEEKTYVVLTGGTYYKVQGFRQLEKSTYSVDGDGQIVLDEDSGQVLIYAETCIWSVKDGKAEVFRKESDKVDLPEIEVTY